MRRPRDGDDILVRSTGCNCGKLTFSNRKIAKKIAKQFRSKLGTRFGTYKCKLCGCWHLYTIKPRPDLRIPKDPVPHEQARKEAP